MKNRKLLYVIILLITLLMLPSPCRTQAAETADVSPARYVTAVSGIPANGALGVNVTVAQNAANAAFRLEYNENVLEFRDLWATENYALQYDLSQPGGLRFSAKASSAAVDLVKNSLPPSTISADTQPSKSCGSERRRRSSRV